MTNSEFDEWFSRHFRSDMAAAKALDLDRDAIASLRSGKTRRGNPRPVPAHIALACAAYTIGLREYDGGKVAIG